MPRRALLFLAAAACLVAAACDDKATSRRGIAPLEPPSAADREGAATYASAKALLDAGDERTALPLLRRAVELAPRHAKALAALGDVLFEQRKFDEASPILKRAVDAAPDDFLHRKRLYELLSAQRDFAGAAAASHAWIVQVRENGEAWYELGCAQHALGRLDAAVKTLETAGNYQSARGDIRSRLGLVRLAQGKTADAEAAQRDALRRDPRFLDAWARLGDVIALAGPSRYAEAIAAYRRAPPASGAVHARLYRLLRLVAATDVSKAPEADAEWDALLAVAGRDMLPFSGLGAPPPTSGDAARDEKDLRAALTARPDDAATRCKYATLLHRRGALDDAVAEYAEAAAAAPADASIHAAFGAALLVKGDVERARGELAKATDLDPTNSVAARNLGWALLRLGRDGEAATAFAAAHLAHADPLARRGRGLAKMHAGDLDGGLADVQASGWTGP